MASISTTEAEDLAKSVLASEADKQAANYRALQPYGENFDVNTTYDRIADAFEAQAAALRA